MAAQKQGKGLNSKYAFEGKYRNIQINVKRCDQCEKSVSDIH